MGGCKCQLCGIVFNQLNGLLDHHAEEHRGDYTYDFITNRYQCRLCRILMDTERDISSHVQSHAMDGDCATDQSECDVKIKMDSAQIDDKIPVPGNETRPVLHFSS